MKILVDNAKIYKAKSADYDNGFDNDVDLDELLKEIDSEIQNNYTAVSPSADVLPPAPKDTTSPKDEVPMANFVVDTSFQETVDTTIPTKPASNPASIPSSTLNPKQPKKDEFDYLDSESKKDYDEIQKILDFLDMDISDKKGIPDRKLEHVANEILTDTKQTLKRQPEKLGSVQKIKHYLRKACFIGKQHKTRMKVRFARNRREALAKYSPNHHEFYKEFLADTVSLMADLDLDHGVRSREGQVVLMFFLKHLFPERWAQIIRYVISTALLAIKAYFLYNAFPGFPGLFSDSKNKST